MTHFIRGLSLALLVLTVTATSYGQTLPFPFVPDPQQTQGSICNTRDPDYLERRYQEKIAYCARNVTSEEKAEIYDSYGVPENCRKGYTIDHFIPLSLGGTNRRDNLWPESKLIKSTRRNLEISLYKQLAKGEITQARAIQTIREAKWNPDISDPAAFDFCH